MKASDLQPFCGSDHRVQFHKPFSRGEYTFATNAAILIRVPRLDDVDESGGVELDSVYRAATVELREPFQVEDLTEWVPAPEIKGRSFKACCSDCSESCNYEIKPNCAECNGAGVVEGFEPEERNMKLGNRILASHYLRLIATLPNAEISTEVGDKFCPAYFRFDGGVGLVMPLKTHE